MTGEWDTTMERPVVSVIFEMAEEYARDYSREQLREMLDGGLLDEDAAEAVSIAIVKLNDAAADMEAQGGGEAL